MRSPARKPILDAIFWQMPKQLDAKQAAEVKTTIRWSITGRPDGGADVYDLHLEGGQARTVRGGVGGDPRLTITMDGVEFLRLVSGNWDPMRAYFTGRVKLAGDIMVAAELATLSRYPAPGDPTVPGTAATSPAHADAAAALPDEAFQLAGLALEIGGLVGLLVGAILGTGRLFLDVALALFLAALAV